MTDEATAVTGADGSAGAVPAPGSPGDGPGVAETVRAAAGPVSRLGGAFMTDPATREAGAALGLKAWRLYHAGRAGVLGDVDASVVAAAEVFFPPERVADAWEKGRAVRPPREVAEAYAGLCQAWGRERLGGFGGAGRLAGLAERVAAGADVAGLPLFAGWRAMPLPDDAPARLAQLLHVLREHRGGLHGVAVLAAGLRPLEAIVAGAQGAAGAAWFGWSEPFPDPEPLRERRQAAEETTDRLVAPAFAALGPGERAELVALLAEAEAEAEAASGRTGTRSS